MKGAKDIGDSALLPDPVRARDAYRGGNYDEALIEQYKVFVRSAELTSSRRIATGRHLLAVNAALAALYGLYGLQPWTPAGAHWELFVPAAGVVGFAVALLWYRTIISYRILNHVKFGIIGRMESHLPAEPFGYEWQAAKREGYAKVTHLERYVPIGFAALHALFVALSMPQWAGALP